MRRGEIWIVAAGSGYAGKPRPAVIIQDDRFDGTASLTIVPFTTGSVDAPLARVFVRPDDANGLTVHSALMVDKVVTVPRAKLGERVGRLGDGDLLALNRALVVFLGLAD